MAAASSDCVKVAIRVRPFISNELNRGCLQIVEKVSDQPQIIITGDPHCKTQELYTFNNVFMPGENQSEVYNTSVKPIIGKLFEGFNVTIFAYGQTGSGKTFTMGTCFDGNWSSSQNGIIPRALHDIFANISKLETESSATVFTTCSFIELYQENLIDLLSGKAKEQSSCEIREDGRKGIVIAGLSEQPVKDATEAAQYLMEGNYYRSVGATAMNEVSSRSHAIFTVNLKVISANAQITEAKFNLVDLAGSERSKKTKATGIRFKEGVKINEGLLALGNVISALGCGSGPSGFVSYRDSKLTRLLSDSLGGNSVTLMIACISPADYNIEETLSTLRYADRAKKIKNKPVKNQDSHDSEVEHLRKIVHELRMQLSRQSDDKTQQVGLMSSASCDSTCSQEKLQKEKENNSLRQQLSNLVTVINGLNSLHLLEETFYTELIDRIVVLRELIVEIGAPFADVARVHSEIDEQVKSIEDLISNFKQQLELSTSLSDFSLNENEFEDDTSNQMLRDYTSAQMEALKKIKILEREMKIKQDLLDRKSRNMPAASGEMEYTIDKYRNTIKSLEKELEELRALTLRRDNNLTVVHIDRKHMIEKLEKELNETRKKCISLEKNKKEAELDRKRVDDLKKEIKEMKAARVQLIRQQRADADKYKKWIAARDKEINQLKQNGKKLQYEKDHMKKKYEKQEMILKRKVDEAKTVNKRLQDAIDLSKKIQKVGPSSKVSVDAIETFVHNELMVLLSTVDAKVILQSLTNDRGMLTERLTDLKTVILKKESDEEEIDQLQRDLWMRNIQIAEIQQKLMQTDLEERVKVIPETLNSAAELKIAMRYVILALMDIREDFATTDIRAADLQMISDSNEERIAQMSVDINNERKHHQQEATLLEREFIKKLSKLAQMKSPDDPQYSKELCDKHDENFQLKQRILYLEHELEKMSDQTSKSQSRFNETFTMNGTMAFDKSYRDLSSTLKQTSKTIFEKNRLHKSNFAEVSRKLDNKSGTKRSSNGEIKSDVATETVIAGDREFSFLDIDDVAKPYTSKKPKPFLEI